MAGQTTPNRLQQHWEEARGFLRREWPRLTEADLDQIDGEYDRLIHCLKEIYRGPDEITQEAPIKGRLQRYLNDLEVLP